MTHISPARFRTALLLLVPLAMAACSQSPSVPEASAVSGDQAGLADSPYDGIDRSWEATANGLGDLSALALTSGTNQLSSLGWTSAKSGWGPVERNKSN